MIRTILRLLPYHIRNVSIAPGCQESFPCCHPGSSLTFEDGQKVKGLSSHEIAVLVKGLLDEQIEYGKETRKGALSHFGIYLRLRKGQIGYQPIPKIEDLLKKLKSRAPQGKCVANVLDEDTVTFDLSKPRA